MINFIKMDDITVYMDFQGNFKFDKRGVKNILTKNYVRYYTVEDDVDEILDDELLEAVVQVYDLHAIIMSVVEQLNEKFVPMMRHKRYSESYIPNYLDLTKFVNKDDIVIYRRRISQGKTAKDDVIVVEANLDLVFRNIERHKLSLKPEEKETILSDIEDEIVDAFNKGFRGKIFDSWVEYNKETEKLKDQVYAKLIDSIVSYNEPVVLNYMVDNRVNHPYFAYDKAEQRVVYTTERVLHLLDALGFEVVENDPVAIKYLDETCERQTNTLKKEFGEVIIDDDMLITNATLMTNMVILNNIVYAANNNIPLDKAIDYEAPEQLLSQIEIEQVYIDRCAEMMDFDYVLEDLSNAVTAPKSSLTDHVHDIINTVKELYKDLVDAENAYDNIYRAVTFTYETEMKYKLDEINGASWANISPNIAIKQFDMSTNFYSLARTVGGKLTTHKIQGTTDSKSSGNVPNKFLDE